MEEIAKKSGMALAKRNCFNLSISERTPIDDYCRLKKLSFIEKLNYVMSKKTKTAILAAITLLGKMDSSTTFASEVRKDMIGMLAQSEEEFDKLCEPINEYYDYCALLNLALVSKATHQEIINMYRNKFDGGDRPLGTILPEASTRQIFYFFASKKVFNSLASSLDKHKKEEDQSQIDNVNRL